MNFSNPLPSMPGFPLTYWLDSDMARMAPDTTTSALRDMAWSFGQWRGLAYAASGLGTALACGGVLAAVMMPGSVALWIVLLLVGVALVSTGSLILARKMPTITKASRPQASRSPQKFSSGLSLSALVCVAVGLPVALVLSRWLSQGPGPAFAFVAVCILFLLGAASAFAVPAYCAEHARRDFRGYIAKNQAIREELEAMSLSWHDPSGGRGFGPL